MLPRLMPANRSPARSPHASRSSTARRLFCASMRTSSSGSAKLPSLRFSTSARSSVLAFGLPESPSVRIAAMRASRSPPLSSSVAATVSSSGLMTASDSCASAFFTRGRIEGSAPPASALTAASRVSRSGATSFRAASADAIAPRSRLLATTSSRSLGSGATASPVAASVALSPFTMSTRFPLVFPSIEICTSPSARAARSSAAFGSPVAASALIAATFSSLSPRPSFSTRLASSATAGRARNAAAASRMMSRNAHM